MEEIKFFSEEVPLKGNIIYRNTINNIIYNDKWGVNHKLKKYDKTGFIHLFIHLNCLFFFIFSIGFYVKSLGGCDGATYECITGRNLNFLYKKYYEMIYCSTLISIILFLSFHRIIIRIFIIPIVIIYPILFLCNRGNSLSEHGIYNTIVFIGVSIIFLGGAEFILFLYRSYTKKYYKRLIITGSITILPFILFIISGFASCIGWKKGINDIEIINDPSKDSCYIREPSFCTIPIFDNIFDFSRIGSNTCEGTHNDKKQLEVYIPRIENYNSIAFPDTTKYSFETESRVGIFHYKVFNDIYNPEEQTDRKSEVIVHYDEKGKGNVEINVTRDENLAKTRNELAKIFPVKYENILFIYIDAISRNHFKRKLPKTSIFIKRYLHNYQYKAGILNAYQFMKYSNFKGTTQENTMPMFYGDSMQNSAGISILKYFKNKGYITCGSENLCHRELFAIQGYKNDFTEFESFDHENYALFCDPNYCVPNNPFGFFQGMYSVYRRCLYGKDTSEYVFEYGNKFWEAYKNERKFVRLSFIDAHEGTMEVIKYLDDYLFKFLTSFVDNYLNDKTAIIIASDHGQNMISLHTFMNSQDFIYERTLGSLFILLPDNDNYDPYPIEQNEQRFVTPYDIHDTLIDFAGGNSNEYSNNGQSLLKEINGLNRNCLKYYNDFDDIELYCSCIKY